jgi:hypothetical protein
MTGDPRCQPKVARDWLMLTWSEKTWGERAQTVVGTIVAGIVGLAMFVGVLWVVGTIVDVQTDRISDHRRCLQNATNGLEIQQCR